MAQVIDTIVEPMGGLGAYSCEAIAAEYERTTGRRCRHEPPVSRTGNKAGFVPNSFRAWGLNRTRWKRVWLNDASAVCHLFHLMYSSDALRREVVKRIYAMIPCPDCNQDAIEGALRGDLKPTPETLTGKGGCLLCGGSGVYEARLLWEKTRKEPVPGDVAQMVASGLVLQARGIGGKPIDAYIDSWKTHGFDRPSGIESGGVNTPDLASRVESLPCGMAALADVTARALFMQSRSFSLKPVEIVGGAWDSCSYKKEVDDLPRAPTSHAAGDDSPRWKVANRSDDLPLSGVEIRATWGDAALVMPEGDASNVLCVLDPPYQNTSGYQADCPREVVLKLARAWHEAGALVLLHEACGLARELGAGWIERPADVLRGRASTFWGDGGQREWITANRKMVWWPEEQKRLF